MFDQDDLKAVATAFVAAAERGEDARAGGAVAEAAATARLRLAEWEAAGAGLPRCEPLLQAADDLLTALHAANEEGLPFGVRDPSTEMLSLLDEAEENGFQVRISPSPAP